jgi:DNA-binding beta-propeller fold protein YncE
MIGAAALVIACTGSAWSQATEDPPVQEPRVQNPRRLADGPHNQVLVTDRRFRAVVAVDKTTLAPVWSFPLPAEGAPFGLATSKRLVFVGNTVTKNVEVYRMYGSGADTGLHFAYNLGDIPEGATGTIENPIAIAADGSAKLVFVLDSGTRQVKIFDRKGAFIGAFAPADEAGQVFNPVSIAVDEHRGEILVGDYGDHSTPCSVCGRGPAARILGYNYDGVLLFQIDGDSITADGAIGFTRVQGMAVSADGRIFATDPLGSRILVLDRDSGLLIAELGTEGSEPGQLMLPLDALLDQETGDLFISNNRGARRIEVLRGAGS